MIVDAEAQQIVFEAVACAGQGVIFLRQVYVEVFGLERPVLGQSDLHSGTRRPAEMPVRFRQSAEVDGSVSVGDAERRIEQDIVQNDPAAAAQRTEPWIRELIAGESVVRVGQIEIRFESVNERS